MLRGADSMARVRSDRSGSSAVDGNRRLPYTGVMRWSGWTALVIWWVAAGCHRPVMPAGLSTMHLQLDRPEHIDRVWEAARDAVRDVGFKASVVDRSSGRFTTDALLSPHFFEFWRRDARTAYDRLESTIAPIRRKVEVSITPADEPTAATLTVTVTRERLSSPDRQFNESVAIFQFFGHVLPRADTGQPITPQQDRWVEIGRDPALEQYLIRRIVRAAQPRSTKGVLPLSDEAEPSGDSEPADNDPAESPS